MWSLGCVIAELFLGWPLYPGASEYDQVTPNGSLAFLKDPTSIPMNQTWCAVMFMRLHPCTLFPWVCLAGWDAFWIPLTVPEDSCAASLFIWTDATEPLVQLAQPLCSRARHSLSLSWCSLENVEWALLQYWTSLPFFLTTPKSL